MSPGRLKGNMFKLEFLKKLFSLIILLLCACSCSSLDLFNSGTVHVKYTVSKAVINDVLYENVDRLGNVSFSIRNVQHPYAYGKWNTNIRLSPSIHLDSTTYQTGELQQNEQGEYERMPNIKYKRFSSLLNLKWTSHTPIGSFSLSAGMGGAGYKLDDGQGLNTIKTTEIRRLDFVWTAFLSRKFFVLMGPRYYKDRNEQYVMAFRIGYFWGRVKK